MHAGGGAGARGLRGREAGRDEAAEHALPRPRGRGRLRGAAGGLEGEGGRLVD